MSPKQNVIIRGVPEVLFLGPSGIKTESNFFLTFVLLVYEIFRKLLILTENSMRVNYLGLNFLQTYLHASFRNKSKTSINFYRYISRTVDCRGYFHLD